jgi:hypothetical protein
MKRFLAKKTSAQGNKSQVYVAAQRSFATGPQKNPYASVLSNLSVGNHKYSFFNLPALQDKRIGKFYLFLDHVP